MSKRFIVAVDSSTPERDEAFKEALTAITPRIAWWHWLTNLWLITDPTDRLSATKVSNMVRGIYPEIHQLVMELDGNDDTWAGFGPSSKDKLNMFGWLRSYWNRST